MPCLELELGDAARNGSVETLYVLIRDDPKILEKIDKIPFVDTPLHVAAAVGKTNFAMEVFRLKRSFSKKLNQDGYTPMHCALLCRQFEVARCLLDFDVDLVRVHGRNGLTPLHSVAQMGNLDLLAEFLKACPRSVEDVTNGRETVFHVALKCEQIEAFKLVLGWLKRSWSEQGPLRKKLLLNAKDEEGKTVFNIAKDMNLPQEMIREIEEMIREFERFQTRLSIQGSLPAEPLREETRNALLVVVALLITLTFQTILTPPGGTWQDASHRAGTAIMGRGPFIALLVFNILSFYFLFRLVTRLLPKDFLSLSCILPLCSIIACFILSVLVEFPKAEPLSPKVFYPLFLGLVAVVCVFFFYPFLLPLFLTTWKKRGFPKNPSA